MDAPMPMLALEYEKRGKDIKFPCFVQPKVDGCRALYFNKKFWSRNGNVFPGLDHIASALIHVPEEVILDGELYCDPNVINFQTLVGLLKKSKYSPQEHVVVQHIEYLVYDTVSGEDFFIRHSKLEKLGLSKPCVILPTEVCKSPSDVNSMLKNALEQGWEGIMLRNAKGTYKTKVRSKDLQKLKPFKTDEFEIIGYEQGTGSDTGCIVFKCKTPQGKLFNVRPQGTVEYRSNLFKKGESLVGKQLTVRYQNLIDESGIPRFPVGLAIRDYE